MTGMRVLDVGAWDGYWTWEALKRGARQVVAIDDFSDYLGRNDNVTRQKWETFDLCKDAFGYADEQVRRLECSLYDVAELGQFDVVLCFGVLYHCRYPLLALDRLSAVCTGSIYVESAISDRFSPYSPKDAPAGHGDKMVMEFYPSDQYGGNLTNWWAPTLRCLVHMVGSAGWDVDVKASRLNYEGKTRVPYERGFVRGAKK
jgi:tRNA (mo5U34)-methyltransferase